MHPYKSTPLESKHTQSGADFIHRAGWHLPERYTSLEDELAAVQQSVGMADLSANGKLILKGASLPEFLDQTFDFQPYIPGNTTWLKFNHQQILLAPLTADEALLLTSPGGETSVIEFLTKNLSEFFVSLVDQTGALAGLLLVGPESLSVMNKLCALSFHPNDFPPLHVAQTSFAKVRTTILRRDLASLPAFELYFDRSYAEYLWETLLDAAHQFPLQPLGQLTLDRLLNEYTEYNKP